MSVVNVKVEYLRKMKPKYNSLEEWLENKNHIYIGRNMSVWIKGADESIWANPYTVKKCGSVNKACLKYKKYIKKRLEEEPKLRKQLRKLKGKTLGCWCKTDKFEKNNKQKYECHGDVLLELIELYTN